MFAYLDALVGQSAEGNLTWEQTAEFPCFDETIVLRQSRGRGIHKPRQLDAALSITTAFTGYGREPRYRDSIGEDGYPRYKYEGDNPDLATNRSLRTAMECRLPLTYFIGVRRSVYKPVHPVYIAGEDAAKQEFILSFSRAEVGIEFSSLSAPEKVYAARMTKQRLHQPLFRERVLHAYATSCAVCRLRHVELLDAAHIIADGEDGGDPVVPNGMALCKIHHAAYDGTSSASLPSWWCTSTSGCSTRSTVRCSNTASKRCTVRPLSFHAAKRLSPTPIAWGSATPVFSKRPDWRRKQG